MPAPSEVHHDERPDSHGDTVLPRVPPGTCARDQAPRSSAPTCPAGLSRPAAAAATLSAPPAAGHPRRAPAWLHPTRGCNRCDPRSDAHTVTLGIRSCAVAPERLRPRPSTSSPRTCAPPDSGCTDAVACASVPVRGDLLAGLHPGRLAGHLRVVGRVVQLDRPLLLEQVQQRRRGRGATSSMARPRVTVGEPLGHREQVELPRVLDRRRARPTSSAWRPARPAWGAGSRPRRSSGRGEFWL